MTEDDLIIEDQQDQAQREDRERQARSVEDKARAVLEQRQRAYVRVFVEGAASKGDVEVVMMDLAKFCRGFQSTFDPEPRISAMLDGRREVFLRIMDFAKLPVDALLLKYHGL